MNGILLKTVGWVIPCWEICKDDALFWPMEWHLVEDVLYGWCLVDKFRKSGCFLTTVIFIVSCFGLFYGWYLGEDCGRDGVFLIFW